MERSGEVHTMDAPTWLTREDIDKAIANLSADDLIESGLAGNQDASESVKAGARAFNLAAARIGLSNGTPATQHMHATDLGYFAEALKSAMDIDGPKSEDSDESQTSRASTSSDHLRLEG